MRRGIARSAPNRRTHASDRRAHRATRSLPAARNCRRTPAATRGGRCPVHAFPTTSCRRRAMQCPQRCADSRRRRPPQEVAGGRRMFEGAHDRGADRDDAVAKRPCPPHGARGRGGHDVGLGERQLSVERRIAGGGNSGRVDREPISAAMRRTRCASRATETTCAPRPASSPTSARPSPRLCACRGGDRRSPCPDVMRSSDCIVGAPS